MNQNFHFDENEEIKWIRAIFQNDQDIIKNDNGTVLRENERAISLSPENEPSLLETTTKNYIRSRILSTHESRLNSPFDQR